MSEKLQGLKAVAHLQQNQLLIRRCPTGDFELYLNREGFAWLIVDTEPCQISHAELLRECLQSRWGGGAMSKLRRVRGLSAIALLQQGRTLRRWCPECEFEMKQRAGACLQRIDGEAYAESSTDVVREFLTHEWWCEHD